LAEEPKYTPNEKEFAKGKRNEPFLGGETQGNPSLERLMEFDHGGGTNRGGLWPRPYKEMLAE